MRKIFFIFVLCLSSLSAGAFEISEGFVYSKDFWQNNVAVSQDINYMLNVGLNFDIAEHDDISHHIYTFSLPLMFRTERFGLYLRPFIVPDNANDASAYGAKASLTLNIKHDEVDNSSSSVFLSAGFANQNAYVAKVGLGSQKEDFKQMVYEGGLVFDYFDTYFFEISGNMFDYISGISDVENVAGVLDQQNIASLDTLNYVLSLPKSSIGAKIKWNSEASQSSNTISYKYIEFKEHNVCPHHSLMFSSVIMLKYNLYVSLAYNHIFVSSQKDKDIFKGAISLKF